MSANQIAIAAVTLATLVLAGIAFRNSRTRRQNLAQFEIDGRLMAERGLPIVLLVLALFTGAMAVIVDHGRGDRTWPIAAIGMAGVVCACVLTLFTVRFDTATLRFGLLESRAVAYADIAELVRLHVGKGAELVLVLKSGQEVSMGENMPCEKLLADEIRKRTGCRVTWHTKGRPQPDVQPAVEPVGVD